MSRFAAFKPAWAGFFLALGLVFSTGLVARQATPDAALATVSVQALPPEGRDTLALIRQGGPFPHGKDGTVFGNRERVLPAQPRGHYREYTVSTPGARDRGARRIVCGGPVRKPQSCYYTSDHYASFRLIAE